MSIAMQQEINGLREQVTEARTQLSKLQAQIVVSESRRSDLAARVGQLEDAVSGMINNQGARDGNARSKARA